MPERIDHRGWPDEDSDTPPVPLTRQQAQALRVSLPASVSPWQVVAAQTAAGLVVAVLGWAWSGRSEWGWSALYGVAASVVPTALLARGIGRLGRAGPAARAVGFMVWQGMKMMLTVIMLVLAVKVVPRLVWPALLAALAACLSMNWLALLWQGRVKNIEQGR
jgi:ATP synthase protein I